MLAEIYQNIPRSEIAPRDYQLAARDAIFDSWITHKAALASMATGSGKSVLACMVIDRIQSGRVLCIVHQQKLVFQMAEHIYKFLGIESEIEMGSDFWANPCPKTGSKVIVASVQSLISGKSRKRMHRLEPGTFSCCIADECHHAISASWFKVIEHLKENEGLKILGISATPDRADGRALSQIFDHVAFEYPILQAIRDGWLVPLNQHRVHIHGLDYSHIKVQAGELNCAELSEVLTNEKPLHKMVQPTIEVALGMVPHDLAWLFVYDIGVIRQKLAELMEQRGFRKSIVFCVTVAHAERMCEVFNRWLPGIAKTITGGTPDNERREIYRDFRAGAFKVLVGVGVLTEGFDEPSAEIAVMARPTLSRSLYAQQIGRVSRPLPGVVDNLPTAEDRKAAIAWSLKPTGVILDFVGNSGRHTLVGPADALAGIEGIAPTHSTKPRDKGDEKEPLTDAEDVVALAELAVKTATESRERFRRDAILGKVEYAMSDVDPYRLAGIPRPNTTQVYGTPATPGQLARLKAWNVDTAGVNFELARKLLSGIPPGMAKTILKFGYPLPRKRADAVTLFERIRDAGWQRPDPID